MEKPVEGTTRRRWSLAAFATATLVGISSPIARAETLDQIKAEALAATAPVTAWDGPTTGPKALKGKRVVIISDTQTNAGTAGVEAGAQEAAAAIGWKVQIIDGQNSATGWASAWEQAIALKPDGIIDSSIQAETFAASMPGQSTKASRSSPGTRPPNQVRSRNRQGYSGISPAIPTRSATSPRNMQWRMAKAKRTP